MSSLPFSKKKCLGGGEDLKPLGYAVGYTLGKLIGKERKDSNNDGGQVYPHGKYYLSLL